MVSDKQQRAIDNKISRVVREFLTTQGTMQDMENSLDIPSSSIQRYLHSKRIIRLLAKQKNGKICKIWYS